MLAGRVAKIRAEKRFRPYFESSCPTKKEICTKGNDMREERNAIVRRIPDVQPGLSKWYGTDFKKFSGIQGNCMEIFVYLTALQPQLEIQRFLTNVKTPCSRDVAKYGLDYTSGFEVAISCCTTYVRQKHAVVNQFYGKSSTQANIQDHRKEQRKKRV